MKYVFDTNSLSVILKHYYPSHFPSFWERFHAMVKNIEIISVREVKNELLDHFEKKELNIFLNHNKDFFSKPENKELEFIGKIYSVEHFQQNLKQKKLLKGGAFADPFVIAKAKVASATVITEEVFKKNGVKIPNICQHFDVSVNNLKGFLKNENWMF